MIESFANISKYSMNKAQVAFPGYLHELSTEFNHIFEVGLGNIYVDEAPNDLLHCVNSHLLSKSPDNFKWDRDWIMLNHVKFE